jgi:predicted XRE-type DNA-binding protein
MKIQDSKINLKLAANKAPNIKRHSFSHSAQNAQSFTSFMSPKQITILMILHDITQTQIAKGLHVTVPAVNSVIKGKRRNPRIRQAIASALGLSIGQIWPPENPSNNNDKSVNHITKDSTQAQGEKQ